MMRALVLSGGGSKGAYQVGVLKRWMLEEGREYDILVGTSVGAINVAGLSQARLGDPKEAYRRLEDVWNRVENSKIRKWWWFWYLASLWRPSVFNSEPLRKWIRDELSVAEIAASGRQVRVGAVSETTGEEYVATEKDPNLAEWVYSSAAYPLAFKPGIANGEQWVDWGIRHVTPLGQAIKLGATEIDVVTTFNVDQPMTRWEPWYRAVLSRGLRDLDIMMDEIMKGDFRAVGDRNEIAQLGGRYRYVKLNIQMPSRPLGYDSLDFSPANTRLGREFGYADSASSR